MGAKAVPLVKTTIKRHMKMDTNESLEIKDATVENKIAEIKGIPTKEELKNLLAHNVITVDFTKVNGDRRVMTCTLREDMKPKATKSDPLSQKAVRETSDAVVSVWDVSARGWRSFRYDRVNNVDIVEEYDNEWFEQN
jgi:hypothetical protein